MHIKQRKMGRGLRIRKTKDLSKDIPMGKLIWIWWRHHMTYIKKTSHQKFGVGGKQGGQGP